MTRAASMLLLAAALAGAGAGAVGAVAATRIATAHDPRGDAPGGLDIVRVALRRGDDGRLLGEMTMAAEWDAAALRGSGTGGAPASACLRIFTRADPTAEPPDYLVCATPDAERDRYAGAVLRDPGDGPPRKVGKASISRPTPRTIYLRFAQSTVRRPATLRFSGEVTVPGSGCPPTLGCRDVAPDPPKTVKLNLRSASSSG
jgi:hypothetical protein